MPAAEIKLKELGIDEAEISRYINILANSSTFEDLSARLGEYHLSAGNQQFLELVFVPLYKRNDSIKVKLMRDTDYVGIPEGIRDEFFISYGSQPALLYDGYEEIPIENKDKFVTIADSLILDTVKKHLDL